MAASPRELEELRRKGLEAEGKKFSEYGLPPSLALKYGSVEKYNEERLAKDRPAAKPNMKQFMDAVKEKTGKEIDFFTASDLHSGVIGSRFDDRNWDKILSSSDPVAAAREATRQYYERGPIEFSDEYKERQRQRRVRSAVKNAYDRQAREAIGALQGYGQKGRTSSGVLDALRQAGFGSAAQGLASPYVNDQASLRRRGALAKEISKFLQAGGGGGIASLRPTIRNQMFDTIGRATTDPTVVTYNRRISGTPFAVSGDPDSGKQRVKFVDPASGRAITGGNFERMQSFGYDPYTLQPMYNVQVDEATGLPTYTRAFDTSTLGYDFGGVDPYSQEGLSSYFGTIDPGTFTGDPYDTMGFQDPYAEIMGRMGYEYEPYDFSYEV